MINFVIGIGSNIDGKRGVIERALAKLDTLFSRVMASAVYDTKALNGVDADYCNCVAVYCVNNYSAAQIVELLKLVEIQFGRNSQQKSMGLVSLDLDLVIYDGVVLRQRDYNYDYFQIGWTELQKSLSVL